MMADKKKRERELLRRKMEAGVDFIGDSEVKFSTKKDDNTFFKKLGDKFNGFIDELKPFKKDVREIKANYDKSISVFFEMIQQVYVFTLFTAALYAYLCITHFLTHKDTYVYYSGICGYMWPCMFFYSRYTEDLAFEYALTSFIFCFVGMTVFLYMWIQFDKKAEYQKIF